MVLPNRWPQWAALPIIGVVVGCSWVPGQSDYEKPQRGQALEIPPGLDAPAESSAMRIPTTSYSRLANGPVDGGSRTTQGVLSTQLVWAGDEQTLVVPGTTDSVWQRVAFALDNIGLEVEERQPDVGVFKVAYVDLAAREQRPGIFSRWVLRRKGPVDHSGTYELRLQSEGAGTVIRLLRDEGEIADESVAQEILSALMERLI